MIKGGDSAVTTVGAIMIMLGIILNKLFGG